jgi:L-fuculose-phosphate aldolase
MGLPGKHPADLCLNKGCANCHSHSAAGGPAPAEGISPSLVEEITKKVLKEYGM